MKTWSLRTRLTVWYALGVLVALSIFSAVVLWQQQRIGLRRVDRELDGLTATLASVLRDEVRERAPDPAREAIDTVGPHGHAIAILDSTGRTLAAEWSDLSIGTGLTTSSSEGHVVWTAETPTGSWRVFAQAEQIAGVQYVIVAGTPFTNVKREQRESLEAMAIGIPLAVLLSAMGGLWLASVGLRPITAMAARASALVPTGTDDLGESDRDDELGQLARAFNGVVARMRAMLKTQRQFMADASHELRTPVSVIRSAADVTLIREHRDEHEYREALTIVGEQGRRVSRLVDDMLVLARADSGYPLQRTRLHVDEMVSDCMRTAGVLAAERGINLEASSPTDVALDGDEELLRRMLLNVVQNAVQHTPPGKRVAVDVSASDGHVVIDVTNEGSSVAVADRERIFDRFVQLDPARRANGSGLGLPIARWIAQAHRGSLSIKDSNEVATTFTIALPLE